MATIEDIKAQANPKLEPIPGPDPAGQNPSFDDRYDQVRTAMASLDSPSGGEVDWVAVGKGCDEILCSVAKDLLIASYSAFAGLQNGGFQGLSVGLETILGLLDRYWESMFPPLRRLRGRGNALDWLVARLETAIPAQPAQASDRAIVDVIAAQWKQLGAAGREKLEDHCPSMRGVDEALQRLQMKLPEAPAPDSNLPGPPPVEAPASDAPAAAAPPSPPAAAAPENLAAPTASAPPAAPPQPETPATAPSPAPPAEVSPETLEDTIRERIASMLEPIREDAPAGEDARFEAEYEVAKAEIAKLESITASDPPDWKLIADRSKHVLEKQAKDLLMGCYHAYAKFREHGLAELPAGLMLVEGLVAKFHEVVFPTRPRGRGNALTWFVEALDFPLGEHKLVPTDRPVVLELEAAVKAFSATTRDKLDDHAPTTRGLTERVQRMLLAVPEKKPEAPPPPKPTPTAAPASAPAPRPAASTAPMPTVTASASSPEEATKFLIETGKTLVSAASMLRRAQPSNPAAYRLIRVGLWMHMAKSPPADAGGKTGIPPLPPPKRTQLETLAANAKHEALLEEAESALTQFRFNLDLHRITSDALEQLGDAFEPARKAIAAEVATLLARMPELLDYSASDSSPLASPETKKWIAATVLAGSGGGGVISDGGGGDDDASVMAEVRGAMKTKPPEAMKIAGEAIGSAPNPRARFLRQLSLAEICLESNKPVLARGMFAGLERDMRDRGLLQWEPALAGRCLEGFVKSIRAATKMGKKYEGADEVFERLCLTDPVAAARLS